PPPSLIDSLTGRCGPWANDRSAHAVCDGAVLVSTGVGGAAVVSSDPAQVPVAGTVPPRSSSNCALMIASCWSKMPCNGEVAAGCRCKTALHAGSYGRTCCCNGAAGASKARG